MTALCLDRAFKDFDTDGSGEVNVDELRGVLHKFGMDLPRQDVVEFIAEVDIDKNGSINFGEFINVRGLPAPSLMYYLA